MKTTSWFPFFIIVTTFLLFGFFSIFFVDSAHDGIVLQPVFEILSGKMLFTESFTQYGALFTLIHATAMKLFGQHLLVLRLTTLVFYSLTAVVLWNIYKRFLPTRWNILVFFLWLSLSPVFGWYFHSWSSVQAGFFQVMSIYTFVLFIERNQYRFLIFTGCFSSLAFWCRQPVGIFNTIAIFVCILLLCILAKYTLKRTIFSFLSVGFGVLCGFAPVMFWLWLNGAVYDWWLQSIVMQIPFAQVTRGISINQFARSLGISRYWKDLPTYIIWILLPLSSMMSFLYSGSRLVKFPQNRTAQKLLVISIISLFSWHQYYPVVEKSHFFWAGTPMMGLFILCVYQITEKKLQIYKMAIFVVLSVFVGGNLVLNIYGGMKRIQSARYTTNILPYLSGIPITKEDKGFYENITNTLSAYFSLFPEKTYINDSNNSFYALFNPSHFHSFHGVFVNWGQLTSSIYPTLDNERKDYVAVNRPLVFTRYPNDYPDYCDMNIIAPEDPPIMLLIPKEIGRVLQYHWQQKFPELRRFSCD